METYTNPPTEPTHGRETDGRRQTRKQGPRTRHQVGSSDMSRRTGPGQPRSRTATHSTGRRVRGTKGQKSRSRSLARMSANATPTPVYQDDSKFFTKKTRSDSTSAPSPRDTKKDRFVTESQHPRAQASGARRRLRSTIPPSRYNLWQYEQHALPTIRRRSGPERPDCPHRI